MIIVKLIGGLGNQMFQYAVGRRISLHYGFKLKLDLSSFEDGSKNITETPRDYALKYFNIKAGIASKLEIDKFKQNSIDIEDLKKNDLTFVLNFFKKKYIKENEFNFNSLILSIKNNVYIDGYWQSEDYFKDISNKIKKEISLKKEYLFDDKNILDKISGSNSISIHIRRGDYVGNSETNKFHGTCPLSYYKNGIDYIVNNTKEKPHLFIFSDDAEWVKNNLKGDFQITYVADYKLKDYEELIVMSKCKHNIIANSSFSWWGAWLNENKNKIVVAPSRWFAIEGLDTPERIPGSWHKIDTTLNVENN